MYLQNRKRETINDESETDSKIENALNKNNNCGKKLNKVRNQILSSSSSLETSDTLEKMCKKVQCQHFILN